MGRGKHDKEERLKKTFIPLLLKVIKSTNIELLLAEETIKDKLDLISTELNLDKALFKKTMRYHFVKPQPEEFEKDKNCDVNSYFDNIEELMSNKRYVTVLFCGPYSKRGSNDNNLTLQLKDLPLSMLSYTNMAFDEHRKKAESWHFLLTLLGLNKEKKLILNDIHGGMFNSLEYDSNIKGKLGSNGLKKIPELTSFNYVQLSKAKRVRERIMKIITGLLENEPSFIYIYISRRPETSNNKTGNWHCIMPNEWIKGLKLRNRK